MSSDDGGLRRADWRFLLPAPGSSQYRHLVLLGGPAGLASRLLEVGVATRVSTALPRGERPDALILLADARVPIARAAACLASDGALYWEIERRPWDWTATRPRSIGRQLQRAGLRPWASYWVVPAFHNARRYLPLDAAASVQWFLDTRYVASTPARLGLEALLSRATHWSQAAAGSLVPSFAAIACGPDHPGGPAWALADQALPEVVRDPAIRPALFTSGQDDGSRVVLLPFLPGAREPVLVLKSARLAAFTGHTQREQQTLVRLRASLPPDLRHTLPEPKGTVGSGAASVFLETVVPGRMLAASTGRWRASLARQVEDLRLATDWLTRFHQSTETRRLRWSAVESDRHLEPLLARYERMFGMEPLERALFTRAREHSGTLAGAQLPIVWCHNDYNPWHVYRAGQDVGVIDWEFVEEDVAARHGPALCDLLYFVLHWAHLARGLRGTAAQVRGFGDLFLAASGRSSRSEAARGALDGYMGRLEMHPGFLPLLQVYTWVERAVDWHQRQLAAGSSELVAMRENQFLRYVRALAGSADALFAHPTGWSARSAHPDAARVPGPG